MTTTPCKSKVSLRCSPRRNWSRRRSGSRRRGSRRSGSRRSWSRKEEVFDNGHANGDLNDNVIVKAPLHEGGMGLRSTSMGDMMHVDGRSFEVAMMGFTELV